MTSELKRYNHIVIATCPHCREVTKNFTLGERYMDEREPDKTVPQRIEYMGCISCKVVWMQWE